jgi:protein-S-isoprenylcysteine O-methyltransferase Ste14
MATAIDALSLAGAALATGGLGWVAWAAWQLRVAGAPLAPGAQPRVLVEEGPYRFSRNPMVLGLAAVLAGVPLALQLPALAAAAPAYLWLARRVQIPAEEARLRRHFGGWYSDYAAQVRRWM